MKTMTIIRRSLLAFGSCALLSGAAWAQGYYDDDIYFDANKAEKEARKAQSAVAATSVVSYSGSDRDVDEYNRRGDYAPVTEETADLGENLEYTRRIEKFHNPDIVVKSEDGDLIYYYDYANDELADVNGYTSPTTINIYVDNSDPWDMYWSPYYYSSAWSWARRWSYYNPWWTYNYTWGYGPSFSWSWNWGPSWSWSWNWGWSSPCWSWGWNPVWGWNPPHHHHHLPAWHDYHKPVRWAGSGASGTPGRPKYAGNNDNRGRRPAGTQPSAGNVGGRRPSGSAAVAGNTNRPSSNNGGLYNPSNSTRPENVGTATGRGGTRRANSTVGNASTERVTGSSSRTSRSSFNSGNSSSSRGNSAGTRSGYNSGSSSSRSSMSSGRSSSSGSRSGSTVRSSGGGGSSRSGGGGGGGRSSGGRH